MTTEYESIANVTKKIAMLNNAKAYLLNGTEVDTAARDYIAIESKTITDLNNLRLSLNDYKDNILGNQNVTKYIHTNDILTAVENEYFFERMGYTSLTKFTTGESFDGGITWVTTITSLIGPHDISNVSDSDDDTITGLMGNVPLPEITLLNVTTPAAGSISESDRQRVSIF